MQYKLFVEWTGATYVVDFSELRTVGDLHPLLKAGEIENAVEASRDSFFCRIEKRDIADVALLIPDAGARDIEAGEVRVTDIRLNEYDDLVATVQATFTLELAEEWVNGEQVTEWIKGHPAVLECFVPYLLLDGEKYSTLCEPTNYEDISITATPANMLQS